MNFELVDSLQKSLADSLFNYAVDRKKAAGRALGTLVELITYYTLWSWNLTDHIVIERKIPEYANPEILHNVEFSLHSIRSRLEVHLRPPLLPITPVKLRRHLPLLSNLELKTTQILSRDAIKRNSTVLVEVETGPIIANIVKLDESQCTLLVCELLANPCAIVECKRVGVEEGMKKGPQSIEKAKQGSYVARTVSSLQRVRLRNGEIFGFLEQENGEFRSGPYQMLQQEILKTYSPNRFPGFVLTIGVVSNHGNWFTSDNQSKELRVLAQSYDWLLFLTDYGLSSFVTNLITAPTQEMTPVRDAFFSSYSGKKTPNRFTKVRIDVEADKYLKQYFWHHRNEIENWFNVITPVDSTIHNLQNDLRTLVGPMNISGDQI